MTVIDTTARPLEDLRTLTDHELADMYGTADDQTCAVLLAEMDRRDQAAKRMTAARGALDSIRNDAEMAVHAQFLAASAACAGRLLSRAGEAARVSEKALWRLPEDRLARYMSEELGLYFQDVQPRITVQGLVRANAAESRAARTGALDAREETISDDRLARDETAALQHGAAASEAPQSRASRPVLSRGRGGSEAARACYDHTGTGRAGGSAQPASRVTESTTGADMGLIRAAAHAVEHGARDAVREARIDGYLQRGQRAAGAPAAGTVAVRQGGMVASQREPLDGAQLLKDSCNGLAHFAIWPSQSALITAALWSAAAHAKDPKTGLPIWQYAPRLFFTSEEGGSGKSKLTKLVLRLSPHPKLLVETTKAALVGFLAERATVGVTELDVLVGTGGRTRWFTAIANAGFDPEPTTSKMSHGKVLEIPLFGPMVLDGLDSVIKSTGVEMKTLMSRCIIVRVKRAPEGYVAPRMDTAAREAFAQHAAKLSAWMAQEVADGIADYEPPLPEGLGNRPGSLWEPLLAVADAAGGPWPDLAREACAELINSERTGLPEDDEKEAAYRSAFDAWGANAAVQASEDADLT